MIPAERIKLEGQDIIPATVDGPPDVYNADTYSLMKARWTKDEEVNICLLCNNKFNQIRRKHHCRVCGNVLCSKCCKEKIPLPQLGIHEPERVCEKCRPVTELVTKSFSHMTVLELGGLQVLICLSKSTDVQIQGNIMSGLHTLSTYEPAHILLVQAGGIKAICGVLKDITETEKTQQIIIQGISALMVFCKSSQLKNQALQDGALDTVMSLCKMSEPIALLALQTLSLIVEDPQTHGFIVDGSDETLARILSLTTASDEQVQELALKILANLSLGLDRHRQKIVQDDFTSGRCLVKAMSHKPKNLQVLVNVSCLVGNLATAPQSQGGLQEVLDSSCQLMMSYCEHPNIMNHISRALANFAAFPQNAYKLTSYIPYIIQYCLKSENQSVKYQGIRAITNLLKHSKTPTVQALLRDGAREILEGLTEVPTLMETMQQTILKNIPARAQPM